MINDSKQRHGSLLPTARPSKWAAILLYDLFMFVQLVGFYLVCWTIGLLCLALDRLSGSQRFLDGYTRFFAVIANIGKAP